MQVHPRRCPLSGRRRRAAVAATHGDALDEAFREMVAHGPSHGALIEAYDAAAAGRQIFDAIAAQFDAVIVPSTTGTAPRGLQNGGSFIFNGLWTMLHTPCVNIPGLSGAHGLPVGLTATGPRFSDARVIAAAGAVGALLSPRP